MVTLRFSHIKKGHAGVYKCYAEDKSGNTYSYDVEVEVLDRVGECIVCLDYCLGKGEGE